jgi:phage repressor protein C with HTH and peptisase S24 domain
MEQPHDRLRIARERAGYPTAAAFAERHRLTEVTYRSHENGTRGISIRVAARYASLLGVSWQWLLTGDESAEKDAEEIPLRTIPVVGYVGAGPFYPLDDSAKGAGIDELMLDENDADPIAVIVRGDSMSPVYRNGDRVRGSRHQGRDATQCIGKDCIVALADGQIVLKAVHRGSRKGTFTLVSYNQLEPPMQDVKIEWCAPVRHVYRS